MDKHETRCVPDKDICKWSKFSGFLYIYCTTKDPAAENIFLHGNRKCSLIESRHRGGNLGPVIEGWVQHTLCFEIDKNMLKSRDCTCFCKKTLLTAISEEYKQMSMKNVKSIYIDHRTKMCFLSLFLNTSNEGPKMIYEKMIERS